MCEFVMFIVSVVSYFYITNKLSLREEKEENKHHTSRVYKETH